MTPFEYILPLVSVLVGLSLADLAISLHRLLKRRRSVKWDWLPLAAALVAVLAVLEMWWQFYASRGETYFTTLGGFLPLVAQLILLFLLNAAALPDDARVEGTNLRDFYSENAPYFWTLYASYVGFILLVRIVAMADVGFSEGGGLLSLIPSLVLLGLFLTLARIPRRSLHAIAVVALLALFLYEWSGLRLQAG